MKTLRTIIPFVLFITYYSFCIAQQKYVLNTPAQVSAFQQQELKSTPYIFEGTIVQQRKKGNWICSVLQITKIYRGNQQIKLGTIKVLSEHGGTDAGPGLYKDSTYIIFGKTNSKAFDSTATDNILTLWCTDHIDFIGAGARWGWRKPTSYKTLNDMYSFFKENGLTVQEEVQQK